MATKKAAAKKAADPKADEAKAAAKKARLEKIKNRAPGQRPNSKQIDIIEIDKDNKVINYGYAVRKTGTLVTSVAICKGTVISTSTSFIPAVKVKSKKEHGTLVPGVVGTSKKSKEEESEEESED